MTRPSKTVAPSPTGTTRLRWRDVAVLYGVAAVALALAALEGDVERLVVGGILVFLLLGFIVVRIRRAALEAEMQARREFLAGMSHDLRTPLNSVIGFSNVLLKIAPAKLSAQEIEYLERVRANGVQLLDIVDDLLARAAQAHGESASEPGAKEKEPAASAPSRERR